MKRFLGLLLLAGCAVNPQAQQQRQRAYVEQLVSQCRSLGFRDGAIPQCALQLHQQNLQARAQKDAAFDALAGSVGMGLLNQSAPTTIAPVRPPVNTQCNTYNGGMNCRTW